MKRIYIYILLFFVTAQLQLFGAIEDTVKIAENYYASGDYSKALSYYLSVSNAGYESASLYYNIGNSYYKTGNFVKAILWYERALLLEPGNKDVLFNLEIAR
ncbi:MAG: tetratricopeptide repeat protein, partial [Bacteroidales bacterium]